jgi:predicted GIY-YIG superfamily endonuclease
MTEKDINIYNNGKIYTIRCREDPALIYVGSTTQPLHKRWFTHKSRLIDKKL